ncbi:MAG TPA: tetratricopeptide repeat protein [Lamprocystis sp. (in: g-proteobacteria)]|nr:tetratricopeptide repeat protein [Lamprocystis sp. (in: g-proteobacteria)]
MKIKPQAPEILRIPYAAFDVSVLPSNARDPGSEAFDNAVLIYFAAKYAAKNFDAAVTCSDGIIRVLAWARGGLEPKAYVIGLLQHRALAEALPLLETMDEMMDDADIAYNRGICLSEMGRFEECIEPLERCLRIDLNYGNARIGLGVALARLHRSEEAEQVLRKALAAEPHNNFAARNLAAVLANLEKYAEAVPLLHQVLATEPDDPTASLALGECLEALGADHKSEAIKVYKRIMTRFADTPLADAAVAGLNRLARGDLRRGGADKPRLDAVMYMQSALERFADLPQQEVGQIVLEIARLGQSGLAVNDPGKRYHLKTLPGDFSGLELVSMMHVGMRIFDPNAEMQTGLDREYEIAVSLYGDKR